MLVVLKFIVIALIDTCFNCKGLYLASSNILREKFFFLKKRQSTFVYVHKRHSWIASLCENYYFCWNIFFFKSCQHDEWFPLSQVF